MTLADIVKNEVIRRGEAEVRRVYSDEKAAQRDGALAGFAIARGLHTPEAFEAELKARRERERYLRDEYTDDKEANLDYYWFHRWGTLQIEHVYQRMQVLWGAESYSARALMQVDEIVGNVKQRIRDLLEKS